MTNNEVQRLCGGTFFTQLLLSRKPTVSQRQRTQRMTDVFHNEDVLFGLLQIVNPDAIKPTGNSFETYTTNYKKCDGSIGDDLQFDNPSVLSAFTARMKNEYTTVVEEATAFCVNYYNGPQNSDHHSKIDREHGRIEETERREAPCHEEATQ